MDSGILQGVWIQEPATKQGLTYNGSNWVNGTPLSSVITDGITIQGDGADVSTEIALKQVFTDSSLTGYGIPSNNLGLALQTVAGSYTNFAATFNNNGILTGATPGGGTVYTDGVTVSGNGSSSNVIKAIVPFGQAGEASVTTTNATQTQIFAMQINGSDGVYPFNYTVKASGGASGAAYFENSTSYHTVSGTATQMGSTTALVKLPSNTTWSVADSTNGTFFYVKVTGEASTTITWYMYWSLQ